MLNTHKTYILSKKKIEMELKNKGVVFASPKTEQSSLLEDSNQGLVIKTISSPTSTKSNLSSSENELSTKSSDSSTPRERTTSNSSESLNIRPYHSHDIVSYDGPNGMRFNRGWIIKSNSLLTCKNVISPCYYLW